MLARRDFLKLMTAAGSASVAGGLPFAKAFAQIGESVQYRGKNAQILHSVDFGQTWQPRMNFGSEIKVEAVYPTRNGLKARLSLRGHYFWLQSSDGARWFSADDFSI